MSGLLVSLIVIESILTVVGLGAYVYRARLEFREENTMILNPAESHLVEGQGAIHSRVRQLDSVLWYVGIGWVVFGLATFVVFLGEGAGVI
jgi:hypothetical protein